MDLNKSKEHVSKRTTLAQHRSVQKIVSNRRTLRTVQRKQQLYPNCSSRVNVNSIKNKRNKQGKALLQLKEVNSVEHQLRQTQQKRTISEETIVEKRVDETSTILLTSRVVDVRNGSAWTPAWDANQVAVTVTTKNGKLQYWKISSTEFVFGFESNNQIHYVTCPSGNAGFLQLSAPEPFPLNNNPNTSTDRVMVATYDSMSGGFVLQPKINTNLYLVSYRNFLLAAPVSREIATKWDIV